MTSLELFAVTAPGLEAIAAAELRALGIEPRGAEPGGVTFHGGLAEIYAANLQLRTASRVTARLGDFRATSFRELERAAGKLPWDRILGRDRPVRFRVTCKKSRLYHSDAVAERLATAAERGAGARLAGASEQDAAHDENGDAQLIIARFLRDRCTVSADTSGPLLHRRGYRLATAKAPLRETLAAAMLSGAGWTGQAPLLDPMCGAGTIPIEGALIARRIAPALANPAREPRPFAFMTWPDFDERLWRSLVERARTAELPSSPVAIAGADRDEGAVEATIANAERAGVGSDLTAERRSISALEAPPGAAAGWLVTNPPYGVRVGERDGLRDLYASLGAAVRRRLPGWTVALLSADRQLEAQLGLELEEVLKTVNGGIPVRVVVGRAG